MVIVSAGAKSFTCTCDILNRKHMNLIANVEFLTAIHPRADTRGLRSVSMWKVFPIRTLLFVTHAHVAGSACFTIWAYCTSLYARRYSRSIMQMVVVHYLVVSVKVLLPVSRFESTWIDLALTSLMADQPVASESERARDQWQCAAVTSQVNLSLLFVSRV